MKVLVVGFGLLLLAQGARAEESDPLTEAYRRRQAAMAKKPGGFAEWSRELEAAKTKRGRGIRHMVIGGGVMIVVPLLAVAADSDGSSGLMTAGAAVGLVGGAGVMGYGGWEVVDAGMKIYDLDQEGRIKGYLSLGPAPRGGAQVALSIRF
jgi:hypothetical protein